MDNLYECMLILDPMLPESEVNSILEHLKETLAAAGGEFDCVNVLGKQRLAYEINHHSEGIRAMLYFRGAKAVAELKREMLVTAGILRSMVVVANEKMLWRPAEEAPPEGEEEEPTAEAEEPAESPPGEGEAPAEPEPAPEAEASVESAAADEAPATETEPVEEPEPEAKQEDEATA